MSLSKIDQLFPVGRQYAPMSEAQAVLGEQGFAQAVQSHQIICSIDMPGFYSRGQVVDEATPVAASTGDRKDQQLQLEQPNGWSTPGSRASNHLRPVKVLLSDGTSYTTDVNAARTDDEIRDYFVGQEFNQGDTDWGVPDRMVRCTGVEIGESVDGRTTVQRLMGEAKSKPSTPDQHQLRIALQTLRFNDAVDGLMGGPNKEEAREMLRTKFGYSDARIAKIEGKTMGDEWRGPPGGADESVDEAEEAPATSYKAECGVKEGGQLKFYSNSLRFATREEADQYGDELLSRWSMPESYRVVPSEEPVNYKFENGKAHPLAEGRMPPGKGPITPYKGSWADQEVRRKNGTATSAEQADFDQLIGQQGSETAADPRLRKKGHAMHHLKTIMPGDPDYEWARTQAAGDPEAGIDRRSRSLAVKPRGMGEAISKKFKVGDRVEKTMGVRLSGVVTRPITKDKYTDGQYREPERKESVVYVKWTDGSQGWISPAHIEAADAVVESGGYSDIISQATGVTDPADLREIEEIMRNDIFHSTLDWQTRKQLEAAAKEAMAMLPELRSYKTMADASMPNLPDPTNP